MLAALIRSSSQQVMNIGKYSLRALSGSVVVAVADLRFIISNEIINWKVYGSSKVFPLLDLLVVPA